MISHRRLPDRLGLHATTPRQRPAGRARRESARASDRERVELRIAVEKATESPSCSRFCLHSLASARPHHLLAERARVGYAPRLGWMTCAPGAGAGHPGGGAGDAGGAPRVQRGETSLVGRLQIGGFRRLPILQGHGLWRPCPSVGHPGKQPQLRGAIGSRPASWRHLRLPGQRRDPRACAHVSARRRDRTARASASTELLGACDAEWKGNCAPTPATAVAAASP